MITGVRGTDGASGFASGLSIGASWNRSLAHERASFLGAEFKAKGANVALGPVAGPLGRIARGGRNWEGFSNDPYLAGELTFQTIQGMQEHVVACVKHWIGNEQETNRNPPLSYTVGALNVSVSTNIGDHAMHELYMWPFQDAVRAGAGAVMCSYNQINGSYGCQNSKTLNGLLKGELGFNGFVVSDWGAQHTGLASADSGLDMAMPGSSYWQNGNLSLMVQNGSLAQTRLDDMATRIVASWYRYAHFEPGTGMPIDLDAPHKYVDARDPASDSNILEGAIQGQVLVKNVNNTLPLNKPKMLSVFGYDAVAAQQNTPTGTTFNKWDFGMDNVQEIIGVGGFNDSYMALNFLSNLPYGVPLPGIAPNGTLITGGGSGAITGAFIDAPLDAIQRQAREDRTYLLWDTVSQNPYIDGATDACLVFVNELASEGWDRPSIADPYSDILIQNVAANCSNTIVVAHNAGVRLVDRWIENPNITAVVFAHVPGQESGQAIVDILYGKQSPSGRLPYTVAKNESDYGMLLSPVTADNTTQWHVQDNFTEGVFIDYKHFLAQNITPRYEFGFGLTYSEFSYSGLSTRVARNTRSGTYKTGNSTRSAEGGDAALWQQVATVTAQVQNTGSVAAAEVAQLYVHIPGGPERQLRGFEKKFLQPGEKCTVSFSLTRRDLSTWDVVKQQWVLQSGSYDVTVGKSVLDIQLKGNLRI